MEFRCRLATPAGEIREEVLVADNEARLRRDLEEKGLYILSVKPRGLHIPGLGGVRRHRIPAREFLVFNQELATLLKAGMPLVQSLDILRQRVANPTFKGVLDDVHEKVRAGGSLSEAFEAQGDLFPGIYTASLLAGEKSGGLEQVLRRYVAYVKVVGSVKRKTLSAMMYPAILVLLSLAVVAIIVVKVVPTFGAFYSTFGHELPIFTRVLLAVSGAVVRVWPLLLLAVLIGGAGTWAWGRVSQNRTALHRLLLRVPIVGGVARKFATSQAARTLATLLGGGMPLVNAIAVAGRAIGNKAIAAELDIVGQRVREGESMAAAMLARGVFPDVAVKMVEVGESTGALQDMLNSLADFYDEEIETTLGRFVTLVEPVMLVVMGIVIAGLLIALYLPVFQLSGMVTR
jgi:type IV pilus assembly protein PilC